MAVSSIKDFWIHPNALTITLNYFGDPQLIQTSMLAGAVIMAYRKDVISYDAAHNFREWKLQAFPTQLNDTCVYYVHAELSRSGDTAMIIYSPVKRDIQGRTLLRVEKDENGIDVEVWDNNLSTESYFIYLGTISASVDNDGAPVERAWIDGFYTGTLDTDQQRMEEASGDWKTMFSLNSVTGLIDVLKTISSATINALTVTKEFIFGGKSLTGVAGTGDTLDQSKVNDATLPTTGYVQKEIEALDDHFLIKDDPDADQSVAGNVTFGRNVDITGNQYIAGTQEVVGLQTLHEGFMTENFNDVGGQIAGAHLTKGGVFSAAGIIANSLTIQELIYNIIRAQGGEYVYSPAVNIDTCRYILRGNGGTLSPEEFYDSYTADDWGIIEQVLLTLRKDELTHIGNPLEVGDIVYGYVNRIGESGQHAVSGQCIMHVTHIDELLVTAVLYQKGEKGVTSNIPPTDGMTIAQRGTEDANKIERMTSFYISAMDGSIIMLDKVMSPTLSVENYGATFGKAPTDLLVRIQRVFPSITKHDPVVYARYGVFENLVQYDYEGKPIPKERNRGEWSYDTAINNPYISDDSVYDVVTHRGSLWKCSLSQTTLEPSLNNSSAWLMLVAKGDDSAVVAYSINPTVNVVYFDTSTASMSVSNVEVSIGENTATGFRLLTQQYELTERGLELHYAIDGEHKGILNISDTGELELESGEGTIVAEDDITFWLEGAEISISQVKDNITLHLVNQEDVELAVYVIPVIKAGSFKSTVFSRDNSVTEAANYPIGGNYVDPYPMIDGHRDPKWSDGIPEGTGIVYTSVCTFYGDGSSSGWSEPIPMSDSPEFEVIYSPLDFADINAARQAIPPFAGGITKIPNEWFAAANERGWYDDDTYPGTSNRFEALWMATNSRQTRSSWSNQGWVVSRIKGEKGDKGDNFEYRNLLNNSNFDRYDAEGETLLYWEDVNPILRVFENNFRACNAIGHLTVFNGTLLQYPISIYDGENYVFGFYLAQGKSKAIKLTFSVGTGSVVTEPITLPANHASYGNNVWGVYTENISGYNDIRYEYVAFRVYGATANTTLTIKFDMIDDSGIVFYLAQPQFELGVTPTPYSKSITEATGPAGKRGLEGPQGEAGPMGCPYGEWSEEEEYKIENGIIPIVYYDPSNDGSGQYYIPKVNDIPKGTKPSDSNYWKVFTGYKFLLANFLMANWAKFGSANGGIFYDKWLFSQDGMDEYGDPATYSEYAGIGSNMMIDQDLGTLEYFLTGKFRPNALIDFQHGIIKAGNFSEPYTRAVLAKDDYGNDVNCLTIDPYKNHNIVCNRDIDHFEYGEYNETYFRLRNGLILLPEYNERWVEDGQHFSIVCTATAHNESSQEINGYAAYGRSHAGVGHYNIYYLITVDRSILNGSGSTLTTAGYDGNWFIWRGLRTKFMLITPNITLRLRLQKVKNGNTYVNFWHVENGYDFMAIDARLYVTDQKVDAKSTLIKDQPDEAFSITFQANSAMPSKNLVTGVDAEAQLYKPIILAPINSGLDSASADLGRGSFDILCSIGNIKDATSDEWPSPIKTLHKDDFTFE